MIDLLLILLLIIGLALVFNQQIKNLLVGWMTNRNNIEQLTADDVDRNMKKDATFDFDAVVSLDFETVAKAAWNQDELLAVGGIAIPSVELNLPIFKGLSNYAITVGAGTMKEEQRIGKGNYALASHHMIQPKVLFGPLVHIEMGASMYLTDLKHIYEYEVTYKEYVAPDRTDLIEDVEDKELVTLVTCDYTGHQRLIVQGELKNRISTKIAPDDIKEAFKFKQQPY